MAPRLLLIEDSPTQLLTIKRTLEAEGYAVISAANGAEGIVRAYNDAPDLIISDVVMTGINGYQLCRLVKHDSELADIPVILLTKLDGSLDRFWGLKSGADRYIPKEPGFQSLTKAVKEILGDSSGRPRLRIVGDQSKGPGLEEINSRLHQLLERLLFEATITDEVRKIGEDIMDLEVIAEKLFQLLSSILDYPAACLVVNRGDHSELMLDLAKKSHEESLTGFVSKVALQLGLPPLKDTGEQFHPQIDNALTQPIDVIGRRVGLLVVVPWPSQSFKPGDQKVVRLICDQLSTVLRLYLSQQKKEAVKAKGG